MKKRDKTIDFKYNLHEYLSFVKKYKLLFGFLVFASVLTQALFIVDKFLYKWVIDDATKYSAGTLLANNFTHLLFIIGLIYFGIVLMRSFSAGIREYLIAIVDTKLTYDLKEKYFTKIIGLSDKFHSNHKTGSLISRITRGSSAIENMTDLIIFNISPLILQFIMIFFIIFTFTIIPSIILFVTIVLFVAYNIYIQNIQKKYQVKWNRAKDNESAFISDIFTNIESIKYFGKEKRINKRFLKLINITKKFNFGYWKHFAELDFGQLLILGVGTIALLYFPLNDFINGKITLGTVVLIYSLYGSITGSLFNFTNGIRNYYRAMADLQDLFEYNKEVNEIKDKLGAKNLVVKKGEIEFKNVCFGYRKDGLLKNFNLKIKPTEKVAFVGHSGCGKTTLIKILNRFYDVQKGSILIDGKDIRDFTQESVRNASGIVPQECILFDDTIYNNIKFANHKASRKDVMQAIKLSQLKETINNLPLKENTIVGERGVKLSGGEKQRVSIARSILANKKILILDEATSSLDSKTEYKIQKSLSELLEGRTSIIVAHRLSTIINSDRIIVLKKGEIIEEGKHDELIKKRGEYYKLWVMQKGGYID